MSQFSAIFVTRVVFFSLIALERIWSLPFFSSSIFQLFLPWLCSRCYLLHNVYSDCFQELDNFKICLLFLFHPRCQTVSSPLWISGGGWTFLVKGAWCSPEEGGVACSTASAAASFICVPSAFRHQRVSVFLSVVCSLHLLCALMSSSYDQRLFNQWLSDQLVSYRPYQRQMPLWASILFISPLSFNF